MLDYWLLFSSGFLSSTLLPGGSEFLFVYYLKQVDNVHWYYLFAVTLGNTLGSIVTYLMGYYFHFGQQKSAEKYPRTYSFCQRWGNISLLLAWLPVIGDVMCLLAGWLKLTKTSAFTAIFIGKGLRYLSIMLVYFAI